MGKNVGNRNSEALLSRWVKALRDFEVRKTQEPTDSFIGLLLDEQRLGLPIWFWVPKPKPARYT